MSIYKNLSKVLSTVAVMASLLSVAEAGGPANMARQSAEPQGKMREGVNTRAPFAFIRYCVSNPQACRSGDAQTVEWSPSTQALVTEVNQRVNRAIRPVNDVGDTWTADVEAGDCEEFALTKRQELLKAGLPTSSLRMAVATTASGEGHAVLVVKTAAGDFVLDNRFDRMLIWHETDLIFHKIASAEDPRLWRRIL